VPAERESEGQPRLERETAPLRVLRFGRVSPLRSQTLWHAIAEGVSAGASPTLSFMRPDSPYVSVGYHHDLGHVDLEACARAGVPVYRRMAGGGAVYLDDAQLFFQIAVPASILPAVRSEAVARLLSPALPAFEAAGLPARLDATGEIVVGDRKVCGHGAAQVGRAVVVVGNLIERFDHAAAAALLRAPGGEAAAEALQLMRRYVGPDPASEVDAAAFETAAVRSYADALGREPVAGELSALEQDALQRWDETLESAEWRAGPAARALRAWQLKVRGGVFLVAAEDGGTRVRATVVDERLRAVCVEDPGLNDAAALASALSGHLLPELPSVLAGLGEPGRRLSAAFAAASTGELAAIAGRATAAVREAS